MALLSTLSDPFTDYPSPYLWSVDGDIAIVGGRLQLSDGGESIPHRLTSVELYQFDSASVLLDAANGTYGRNFTLMVAAESDTGSFYTPRFVLALIGDILQGYWSNARDVDDGYANVDYDPATMRYLRLRSSVDGDRYSVDYETSADGLSFTSFARFTGPRDPFDFRVSLDGYFGITYLADFNIYPTLSLLRMRGEDNQWRTVGTAAAPLRVRAEDGSWIVVDGSGVVPVKARQADGSWLTVAYKAAP